MKTDGWASIKVPVHPGRELQHLKDVTINDPKKQLEIIIGLARSCKNLWKRL
jgi:hypothetical protein